MKLISALTILAVAAAGPAFAEGKCTNAPKSKWQPKSALEIPVAGGRLQSAPDQGRGRLLRGLRDRQGRQARQHGLQRRDSREARQPRSRRELIDANAAASPMIRVWDPFVRAFHWALALSFAVAWLSSENMERRARGGGLRRRRAGCGANRLGLRRPQLRAVLPVRALVRRWSSAYLKAIAEGSERAVHRPQSGRRGDDRRPAGRDGGGRGDRLAADDRRLLGLDRERSMFIRSLRTASCCSCSRIWSGVALASVRHRENLVRAMVVGVKRAPSPAM